MQKTRKELYDLISDLKTKKDFEKEIKKKYETYGQLIDHDTIALLIVDELGRNKQSSTTIAQLTADDDYTIQGTVQSISEVKTFTRRNGTPGKVVNLQISDDTGSCRVVLWNGDIDHIKNKDISVGTRIKIINGYTKQGYTGDLEINLGRWGLLEVQQTTNQKQPQTDSTPHEITGVLLRKEATRAFFKDNGEFGFVTTITMKDKQTEKEITLWDRCVKDIQACKIGDIITLSNIALKQSEQKTEFHLNGNGTVKRQV